MKKRTIHRNGCRLVFAFLLALFVPSFASAQCYISDPFDDGALHPSWTSLDINTVDPGATTEGSALTNTSEDTGFDPASNTDSFRYVYLTAKDDTVIDLTIRSMPESTNGRLGIMFRVGTTVNAAFAFVGAATTQVSPSLAGNFFLMRRDNAGLVTSVLSAGSWAATFPIYVRVIKTGRSFTGYYSTDGNTWTGLGTRNVAAFPLSGSYQVGIAMGGNNPAIPQTGIVGDFNVVIGTLCTATPHRDADLYPHLDPSLDRDPDPFPDLDGDPDRHPHGNSHGDGDADLDPPP
jgi:hypothetical protein